VHIRSGILPVILSSIIPAIVRLTAMVVRLRLCVVRLSSAGLLLLLLTAAAGDDSKKRHAAILARVLSYELTLDERAGDAVTVAVVYKSGDSISEANANEWLQQFSELSSVRIKGRRFFATKVAYRQEHLVSTLEKEGADVILVCEGLTAEAETIARFARTRRVLTAGNDLSYVQKDLTVCVTEEGERTRIFINLNSAQQEGIRFSSNLLKLATVLR
jgi:hypothetical protein